MKRFVFVLGAGALMFFVNAQGADLDVGASIVPSYCTEYFGMVNITFTNNSGHWIDINKAFVSFDNDATNKGVQIIVGPKLASWGEGISSKIQHDAFYARLFLGSIAAIGAGSNGQDLRSLAFGAAGILSVKEIAGAKERIDVGHMVPATHLLAGSIFVPPGLSVTRWIVLGTTKGDGVPYVTHMILNMDFDNAHTKKLNLVLRHKFGNDSCVWQSDVKPVQHTGTNFHGSSAASSSPY